MNNLKDLIEGAYYEISCPAAGDKALDRTAFDGRPCVVADYTGDTRQKFAFVLAETINGAPWYYICPRPGPQLLRKNGSEVTTRAINASGYAEEKWILEQVNSAEGTFCIKYANDQTLAMVVSETSNDVIVEKYNPNDSRHQWKLSNVRYGLEYKILDIKYEDIPKTQISSDVVYSKKLQSDGTVAIEKKFTMKKKEQNSFTWTFTETLTVGASATFDANVPFLGKSSVTLSAEFSFAAQQSITKTDSMEYIDELKVTAPVGQKTDVTIVGSIDWDIEAIIPFTMDVLVTGWMDDANIRWDAKRNLTFSELKKLLSSKGECTATINPQPSNQKALLGTLKGNLTGELVVDSQMVVKKNG